MIHELRIYTASPGRLPDLIRRFDTITLRFWDKHGIHQIGFWTTLVGPSSHALTYMLAWESMPERDAKMNAFATDPEWLEARARTEADGPLVLDIANSFLRPTSFSVLQ